MELEQLGKGHAVSRIDVLSRRHHYLPVKKFWETLRPIMSHTGEPQNPNLKKKRLN